MTTEALRSLPVGTRVTWNRSGTEHGHGGRIAESGDCRYIQWDDGSTITLSTVRGVRLLRWVKRMK